MKPMTTRRNVLAGAAALMFFPALGEAKEPGPIGRYRGWRVKSWSPQEGGVISVGKGWDRGNVSVEFHNWTGRTIRGSMPAREYLRLARGFDGPVAFQDLGRILDFGTGKVPVLRSDIRRAFASPAWLPDHEMVAGVLENKPLFGDREGQLRDGNQSVFASREYVAGEQHEVHPAQVRWHRGEYDPRRKDYV